MVHAYVSRLDSLIKEPGTCPYSLPKGYEWYHPDPTDPDDMEKIYQLLLEHYVSLNGVSLRYSKNFLKWAFCFPNAKRKWLVAVKATNGLLVALISGRPIRTCDQTMVFINFLCTHKKLRGKRLAPLLISELARLFILEDSLYIGLYTSSTKLDQPMIKTRNYSRCLNPRKLISIGFDVSPQFIHSFKDKDKITEKYYKVNYDHSLTLEPLVSADDLEACHELYKQQIKKYKIAPHYNLEEFKHWYYPREEVVYTYVVKQEGQVRDFVSFYSLSSYYGEQEIKSGRLFGYTCLNSSLVTLIKNAMYIAQTEGFDVFSCINIMDNHEFMDTLRFIHDDKDFYYYIYNYEGKFKAKDLAMYVI